MKIELLTTIFFENKHDRRILVTELATSPLAMLYLEKLAREGNIMLRHIATDEGPQQVATITEKGIRLLMQTL